MTGAARLSRMFARAGLTEGRAGGLGLLVARADWVFDQSLIVALAKRPGSALVAPDGQVVAVHALETDAEAVVEALSDGRDPAGVKLQRLDPMALAYNDELRKREAPVLSPLSEETAREVEARTFQGSYKGVTDLVTKYVWPTPARIVTRWCAQAGITPNQVTLLGLALTILTFWLFWKGHFAWGLAAGWMMTFLDTVDGKLARTTLTSSSFGNVLDHGIDLIHPPFWWWAWLVGVQATTQHAVPWPELMLAVIVGGYVLQRVEEGIFIALFKIHMHAWRPFDSFFRLITARRNPNLILLTVSVLFGRPDMGLIAVAAWTAICLVVHALQIVQALMARGRVVSWLAR